MQRISALVILSLTILAPFAATAQQEVEMADALRTSGKIYAIVAIILIVLAGLFVYLFTIDRKIGKLEKELEKRPKTK